MLIKGLPEDSATWRDQRPGWTQQDELLAQHTEVLGDAVRVLVYWLQVVASPRYGVEKPQMPPPFVTRFEHPDRPRPIASTSPDDGASSDRLPPKLTPELARQVGLI